MNTTATESPGTRQAPPHELIWEVAQAIAVSRSLHVVADLGVADHVGDAPVPAEQLAAACGADPDAAWPRASLAGGTGDLRGGYRRLPPHELLCTPA